MGVWQDLLGAKLQTADGEIDADKLTEKTAVGLYFSAHWCPPCRGFTPKLAQMYKDSYQGKGMEIVFVSSDKNDEAFKDYFAEMPWLSLPFDARDAKNKLSKKYKVQGIPSFVILDAKTGKTITTKGREAVTGDPTGEKFPWTSGEKFPWIPRPLIEMLKEPQYLSSVDKPDEKLSFSAFDGKKLGLYFSAHWCPPCRGFTPMLSQTYKKIVEEKKENFDIIFISSDREQSAFDEYFGEMPWKALPWEMKELKQELSSHFDVSGIPCLVLLDENREIIQANAVGKIRNDPTGSGYPYPPQLVSEIDDEPDGIDEVPSLVLLIEECPVEEQTKWKGILMQIAEKYKAEAEASEEKEMEFNFFCATKNGQLADRVRGECAVTTPKKEASVVLMDIQDNGGYYEGPKTLSLESLEQFLKDYKDKKLERKQMG